MPPGDPELAHPEAAGWVLGILDADDADRFAGHLQSCPDCRAAVAELGPAARLLQTAAPAAAPPPDLQDRTMAGVAKAAAAARPGGGGGWWRSWNMRMLALAAAVVVIAGSIGAGLLLSRPAPAETYSIALHPGAGLVASGQATVRQTSNGYTVQLTAAHLPGLASNQFYECWWIGPRSPDGHRAVLSAGSFIAGTSGTATVQMTTAADPDTYQTMEITVQTASNTSPGRVILTGVAADDD
jgi:anti-sigma-K factor RskA